MSHIEIPPEGDPLPVPDVAPVIVDQPLTRRTLTVAFGVIGLSLASLAILGALLLVQVRETGRQNRSAIKALDRITHPTPQQFKEDLKTGIERCLKVPDCRRLFPAVKQTRNGSFAVPQRGNSRKASLDRTPGTVAVLPESQRRIASPRSSRPTATTNPPRRSRKPSGGSSPPPSPPPQSSGPTPPSATIPAPVRICTDLVRVNCP